MGKSSLVAPHSRARYLERYGSPLDVAGLRDLERRLGNGEGLVVRRQADSSEVRVIRHAGHLVTVAYDTAAARVKTFLPADATLTGRPRRGEG